MGLHTDLLAADLDGIDPREMSEHFRAVAALTPQQLSGMLGWAQQGQDYRVYALAYELHRQAEDRARDHGDYDPAAVRVKHRLLSGLREAGESFHVSNNVVGPGPAASAMLIVEDAEGPFYVDITVRPGPDDSDDVINDPEYGPVVIDRQDDGTTERTAQ